MSRARPLSSLPLSRLECGMATNSSLESETLQVPPTTRRSGLRLVEKLGASPRDARARRGTARHGGPAAFLNEAASLPCAGLPQLDHLRIGIGLLLKLLGTNGRENSYDGAVGSFPGVLACGPSRDPSSPIKSD